MPKLIIKDGDKITVRLMGKKPSGAAQGLKRPLLETKKSVKWGRRRLEELGIEFYDFGESLVDGIWVTNDWNNLPVDLVTGAGGHAYVGSPSWQDPGDYLFVDVDDWETTFRKLSYEDAEKYSIDLIDTEGGTNFYSLARNGSRRENYDASNIVSDTKWTPQGFQSPSGAIPLNVYSLGSLAYTNFEYLKATETPSYAASAVPDFEIQPQAKVFMMPFVTQVILHSSETPANDGLTYVVSPWMIQPRSFWLNKVHDSADGFPLWSRQFPDSGSTFAEEQTWHTADKTEYVNFIKNHSGSRAFYFTTAGGNVVGEVDPTAYPHHPDSRYIAIDSGASQSFDPIITFQENKYPEGALIAAVKQNGSVYYLWNTEPDIQYNIFERAILL